MSCKSFCKPAFSNAAFPEPLTHGRLMGDPFWFTVCAVSCPHKSLFIKCLLSLFNATYNALLYVVACCYAAARPEWWHLFTGWLWWPFHLHNLAIKCISGLKCTVAHIHEILLTTVKGLGLSTSDFCTASTDLRGRINRKSLKYC